MTPWGVRQTAGILLILISLGWVEGLRLLQVQVPAEVEKGRSAVLGCRFEMQGDTLYSVKWYKGGKEFFRVLPKDSPPTQTFAVDGIQVNVDASNQNQVVLDNITVKSEGRYKCEVSAEAPNFQTVFDVAEMSVVVPPRDSPLISSPKKIYRVGDEFTANCSSFPSRPPAVMSWTLGDKQIVNHEWLLRYGNTLADGGLEGSTLGLKFRLKEEHFDQRGKMHLTCTAIVGRMRIDGRARMNISNADGKISIQQGLADSTSSTSSYPKQRSLIFSSSSALSRWQIGSLIPFLTTTLLISYF